MYRDWTLYSRRGRATGRTGGVVYTYNTDAKVALAAVDALTTGPAQGYM